RPTHYERSKQEADRIVVSALERGLPAVFLHPAGVYGPAPVLAPGANEVLAQLAKREIPMLLPGGFPVVYSEDVAEGHLTAAESAPVGGRYILSEAYYTLADMARAVKRHVPEAKVPPVMPMSVARAVSVVGERIARVTKKPPLIPRGGLYFLESDSRPLSGHAQQELRWRPKSFDEGLERTFAHFRERGWVEGSPASA
ncbi:MAG: NAD-dependent epimerase/dehydratase family protein, partial [Gaiellaceae bacterium]